MAQTPSLLLLFLTVSFSTIPISTVGAPHIQALVTPITKDNATSLYTLSLNSGSSFFLDLTGPLLWAPCAAGHPTVLCGSNTCSIASSFYPQCLPAAPMAVNAPCICSVSLQNPVNGKCGSTDLSVTNVTLATTNGKNPAALVTAHRLFAACAPKSLLASLPAAVVGVAGLGRSELSLPSQLAASLSIVDKFAVCLPGTSGAPGVAFFGSEPFFLLPPGSPAITNTLSYTPLLKNNQTSPNPAYYIGVKGVAVSEKAVRFPAGALDFDQQGHGGVELSTAVPYTALRSDIYEPFLRAYADATKGIPRAPTVKPFGLCLQSKALSPTRLGYAVPQIDLMLADGKNWTVFGANSMYQVDGSTVCLAFVDAGPKAEQAVVIGGFQMEDNFLLFDVAGSRLGFSSLLFGIRTTCQNFNFTSGV